MTSLEARLRALVATWRAEADAEDARLKQYCYGGELDGDMLDENLSRGFTVNGRMRQCAAELDAMLGAPIVSPISMVIDQPKTEAFAAGARAANEAAGLHPMTGCDKWTVFVRQR